MILKIMHAVLASAASLVIVSSVSAVDADPVGGVVGSAAPITPIAGQIPAKTQVMIEIVDSISSKTSVIGDMFAIKLADPLVIDGKTILPAGLSGRGEVTHAAKSGGGGKAGELIVNARYLECGDLRIPLGHFHYQVVGGNNLGGAYAASVVPFGQFLVSGHDAVIPAGTRGTAQINADVPVPTGAIAHCGQAG